MTSDEKLEVEHHEPAEAEAADAEHHGVADPPHQTGSPMVPQATRADVGYGAATHVERINPELRPLAHRVISYAAAGHPEGEHRPYRLTRAAFTVDGRIAAPGEIVHLLPHEVAAFHRPVSGDAEPR